MYVDDMIIASKNINEVDRLKSLLSNKFDIKKTWNQLRRFLAQRSTYITKARKLWVSRKNYLKKMLEKCIMTNVKPMGIPFANHFRLSSKHIGPPTSVW